MAIFGHFWAFFAYSILTKINNTKRLVIVISVKGCMLPPSWCAKNNNLTLFWCQTMWLLFSTLLFMVTLYICIAKIHIHYALFNTMQRCLCSLLGFRHDLWDGATFINLAFRLFPSLNVKVNHKPKKQFNDFCIISFGENEKKNYLYIAITRI